MYLKEIITNGFKSFADKMNIKLDDETTCIVGPNGSGKSNIVDAIRWVLGEQSVKNLRGDGTMSDVIFAGSASRNAKNAASVELVFDNSDHYLNINYTEVSIKRRVFRTGENQYYINQEKCRLKDIIDLFLDSGIGKESFNIISQGEVQKILSESKDERRIIFEEAAGILKYKKRKEEALRKLDRTNTSLDRVEDIIQELESQVTPLKHQAEQAKKYQELKENLENLEISLLAFDIYNLDQEKKQTETTLQKIETELTQLLSNSSILGSEEETLKQTQLEQEKRINDKQTNLLKITEEVANLNAQLTLLRSQKQTSNPSKQEKLETNLRIEKATLEKEMSLLKEQTNENKQTLLHHQETRLKKEKELENITSIKKQLQQEYNQTDREKVSNEHKIELLKQEQERITLLPRPLQILLQEKQITGLLDVIGKIITAKNGYEQALATAIAASKNFMVTKDEQAAKQAIYYLKEKKLGRATFFPLDIIKARMVDDMTIQKLHHQEGYLGILADLVEYDSKFQSIVFNQLGQIIIADNLDNATKISKEINRRYKVITLKGDVINVGGSLTGGSSIRSQSVITLNQEIEALQRTINQQQLHLQELITKLENNQEALTKHQEELFAISNQQEQLQQLNKQQENKKIELLQKIEIITTQLDNIQSTSSDLNKKEAKLIENYYQKETEKEQLEISLNKEKEQLEKTKQTLEEKQADNKYQNNQLRAQEEKKNKLIINLNKIDLQLDTMLETLAQNYTMTYEKARANYPLEIEVELARAKVANYKASIKQLGMVNLAAIEEYKKVRTRYEFLLHQKEDLENAKNTLFEIMDEMDEVMKEEFMKTFQQIKVEFKQVFKELFHGGQADLILTNEDDILTTGIDIVASPPGKKLSTINLLSGGEKTLTAISLLFAILNVRTVPFCIFDEVEAALDEANVDQFGKYLNHYKNKTQFLIITHKKKTMEYADTLYGITMQESGVSKLVSVKLQNKEELI